MRLKLTAIRGTVEMPDCDGAIVDRTQVRGEKRDFRASKLSRGRGYSSLTVAGSTGYLGNVT